MTGPQWDKAPILKSQFKHCEVWRIEQRVHDRTCLTESLNFSIIASSETPKYKLLYKEGAWERDSEILFNIGKISLSLPPPPQNNDGRLWLRVKRSYSPIGLQAG